MSVRLATLTVALATLLVAAALPTARGSGADLVGRFYLAERGGEHVDVLTITDRQLTNDAKSRLMNYPSLSWGLLTGLQQRALLWDAGLVLTADSTLAQVLTTCSNTMADIMLDAQVVEQLVRTAQSAGTNCTTSACGGNSRFLETCPTDVIAAATRCVVDPAGVKIQSSDGAFWAEDGGNDDQPAPVLRDHSAANASTRLFAIHVTAKAFVGVRACEATNRIIIPCREKTASDTNLCTPAPGRTLDAWLRYAAVPDERTFSTTSGVLLVLLLVVCATLGGVIYYLVKYRLARGRGGDSTSEHSRSSHLLSHEQHEQLAGVTPMDAFAHAGNRGGDPTFSNDALCAKSPLLRRFVADPAIVTKRIAVGQLTFLRVLSKGGNGEVWLGQYESRYVALKCLLASKREDITALERFTDEIRLASVLEHPRIVAFCGVAWQSLLHLCAVTEYLERGDLEAVLGQSLAASLTWEREKLLMAADIAEALVYLHSLEPVIIHRDLKSKNVLLDRHLRAKLSDFGLSRETSVEDTMTNGVGTILWSAPEVLEGKRYDEKADIFSFGIVLSEIDTCMLPYGFNKDRGKSKMKSMQIVHLVAEGKLLPSFRDDCPPPIVELARACLELEPEKRPTAMEVVYCLRSKVFPRLVALNDDDTMDGA